MEETVKYTAQSIMSKKRYNELETSLKTIYGAEKLEVAMKAVRDIMKFDPEASTYTKERGKKSMECQRKSAEKKGQSLYYANGGKKCYEKKKMQSI